MNSLLDSPGFAVVDALTDVRLPFTDSRVLPADYIDMFHNVIERVGHGGIEFIGVRSASGELYEDTYRAFWPGDGASAEGRVITSLDSDDLAEGSHSTRAITMADGINEALVYLYWYGLERQPLDYSVMGYNCCSAVALSIQDGFPQHPTSPPPEYSPFSWAGGYIPWRYSNPYYLEEWANEVNAWLGTT